LDAVFFTVFLHSIDLFIFAAFLRVIAFSALIAFFCSTLNVLPLLLALSIAVFTALLFDVGLTVFLLSDPTALQSQEQVFD
jgi:hypothetical protein